MNVLNEAFIENAIKIPRQIFMKKMKKEDSLQMNLNTKASFC